MLFINASGNIARHRFSDTKSKTDFVESNGNVRHELRRPSSDKSPS